jgi:hypothetical protein
VDFSNAMLRFMPYRKMPPLRARDRWPNDNSQKLLWASRGLTGGDQGLARKKTRQILSWKLQQLGHASSDDASSRHQTDRAFLTEEK